MSAYPTIGAGQGLTALTLTDAQPRLALALATESVNNSTTLQMDNELTLPLEANASYLAEFVFGFTTSGSSDCDLKTDWVVPIGSTGLRQVTGSCSNALTFSSRTDTWAQHRSLTFGSLAVYQMATTSPEQAFWEYGIVSTGGTAGDVTLRWAQNSAVAINLVRSVGSFLRVTRYA